MRRQYSLTSSSGPPSPPGAPPLAAGSTASPSTSSSSSSSSSSTSSTTLSSRRVHPHFYVSVIFTLHLTRCVRRSVYPYYLRKTASSLLSLSSSSSSSPLNGASRADIRREEEALCRVLVRVYRKLHLQRNTAKGVQVRRTCTHVHACIHV